MFLPLAVAAVLHRLSPTGEAADLPPPSPDPRTIPHPDPLIESVRQLTITYPCVTSRW